VASELNKVRAHIYVSGRVQGVFFRSSTRVEALRLGIAGWVRNLNDGRVEALFEGDSDKVTEMIEFCKKGSPSANVEKVDVLWEDYIGDVDKFRIIR
jgi:acylphosphatase